MQCVAVGLGRAVAIRATTPSWASSGMQSTNNNNNNNNNNV